MKIAFQIPIAKKENACIQMENKYFFITEIAHLCRTKPVPTTDGTYATWYLQIDKLVQAAGYSDDSLATVTAATSFEMLDNDKTEVYSNFQRVSVARIVKGTYYLLPFGTYAPLDIVPNPWAAVVTGAPGATGLAAVIAGSHYPYLADRDTDLMNNTSISNCITVMVDGKAKEALDAAKSVKATNEAINWNHAVGAVQVANQLTNTLQAAARSTGPVSSMFVK